MTDEAKRETPRGNITFLVISLTNGRSYAMDSNSCFTTILDRYDSDGLTIADVPVNHPLSNYINVTFVNYDSLHALVTKLSTSLDDVIFSCNTQQVAADTLNLSNMKMIIPTKPISGTLFEYLSNNLLIQNIIAAGEDFCKTSCLCLDLWMGGIDDVQLEIHVEGLLNFMGKHKNFPFVIMNLGHNKIRSFEYINMLLENEYILAICLVNNPIMFDKSLIPACKNFKKIIYERNIDAWKRTHPYFGKFL